jgi:hypothetical protein
LIGMSQDVSVRPNTGRSRHDSIWQRERQSVRVRRRVEADSDDLGPVFRVP